MDMTNPEELLALVDERLAALDEDEIWSVTEMKQEARDAVRAIRRAWREVEQGVVTFKCQARESGGYACENPEPHGEGEHFVSDATVGRNPA